MRTQLKGSEGERIVVIAVFERYGSKAGWTGVAEKTVLLLDLQGEDGKQLADHLWLNLTKGIEKLGELKKGDRIKFEGRVKEYKKGYYGFRGDVIAPAPSRDLKLSHPTKFQKI